MFIGVVDDGVLGIPQPLRPHHWQHSLREHKCCFGTKITCMGGGVGGMGNEQWEFGGMGNEQWEVGGMGNELWEVGGMGSGGLGNELWGVKKKREKGRLAKWTSLPPPLIKSRNI